jgi:hypothetical protein
MSRERIESMGSAALRAQTRPASERMGEKEEVCDLHPGGRSRLLWLAVLALQKILKGWKR